LIQYGGKKKRFCRKKRGSFINVDVLRNFRRDGTLAVRNKGRKEVGP